MIYIITNVWNTFSDKNPFIETIAWTRSSSHLNQILQILITIGVKARNT